VIAFVYNGRHRVIADPVVRFTKKFDLIITGADADHGQIRTFRVDRIKGKVRHLGVQAEREQTPRIPVALGGQAARGFRIPRQSTGAETYRSPVRAARHSVLCDR
jgi:hypothetical protein